MKEIDFDELDRAVSSLMKTVPPGAPDDAAAASQTDDAETVVTIGAPHESSDVELMKELKPTMPAVAPPSDLLVQSEPEATQAYESPQPESEPEIEMEPAVEPKTVLEIEPVLEEELSPEPELEPVSVADEAPVVAAPVSPVVSSVEPTPRRGRFMDMVRPGTRDVKRTTPSGAPSRQGVTLQPMMPTEDTASVAADSTADLDELDSFSNQLETAAFSQSFDTPAVSDTTSDLDATEEAADDAPLSSPFLADAVVEKRPLGRPADATPVVDLAAELNESVTAVVEPPAVTEPFEDSISPNKDAQLPEQPLPAELGSELLSIETSTENLPPEPQPQSPIAQAAAPYSAPQPVRPTEMTSIPQQYKVQPRPTEAAPTGTIYDTQPLAHPAKKKPGWVWVAAILAILVIGAGFGAIVYYLNLV